MNEWIIIWLPVKVIWKKQSDISGLAQDVCFSPLANFASEDLEEFFFFFIKAVICFCIKSEGSFFDEKHR